MCASGGQTQGGSVEIPLENQGRGAIDGDAKRYITSEADSLALRLRGDEERITNRQHRVGSGYAAV